MMKHPRLIAGYAGTLEQLAKEIANLHHDSRQEVLEALAFWIRVEAEGDKSAGLPKLADLGLQLAGVVDRAVELSASISALTSRHETNQKSEKEA